MVPYKVPARKILPIELEDGTLITVRNPSGSDLDALDHKIESEEGKDRNLFYEYVLKLSEGTDKPVTMEQLKAMDSEAFTELLKYVNASKKN